MTQVPIEIRSIEGGNVAVDFYYNDIIVREYTSEDASRRGGEHPTNDALLKAFKVTEIRHYKKQQGPEHEYIVARVEYRNPAIKPGAFGRLGKTPRYFVQIERGGGNPNQPVQGSKNFSSSGGAKARDEKSSSNAMTFDLKMPASASGSYPIAQLLKLLDANDKVSQLSAWPAAIDLTKLSAEDKRKKIKTVIAEANTDSTKDKAKTPKDFLLRKQKLQKSGAYCTLADIMAIFYIVHSNARKYKLSAAQCYYLASLVYNGVSELYPPEAADSSLPAASANAEIVSASTPGPLSNQPVYIDIETGLTVGPENTEVVPGTDLATTAAFWDGEAPPDPSNIEQEVESDAEETSSDKAKPQISEGDSLGKKISGTWKYLPIQTIKKDLIANTIAEFKIKQAELHTRVCQA